MRSNAATCLSKQQSTSSALLDRSTTCSHTSQLHTPDTIHTLHAQAALFVPIVYFAAHFSLNALDFFFFFTMFLL
jgi:hypothetical protein